jgi:DNA mismatch endonuclease (patch repair protein)
MAGIKGTNTKPEMTIRHGLHSLGFRYLLHDKRLPGRPDLVLPKWKAVVFVHGCFWHGHDCALYRLPQTRPDFWKSKVAHNRERDAETETKLIHDGWRVLNIWECALKGKGKLGAEQVLALADEWIRSHQGSGSIRGS